MGCCASCYGNSQDIYEDNETTDKTNLLGNPVGETSRTSNYFSTNHRQRLSSATDKVDEHAKLSRILSDTAKNYIDVPALNSPIEQPNYCAWEKLYGDRIRDALKHHDFKQTGPRLLTETSQIEQMLSVEPLSEADRSMISETFATASAAMEDFKVDYRDSIIIPFSGYPKIP